MPPRRISRPSYHKEKTRYFLNSMLGCADFTSVITETVEDKTGESSYQEPSASSLTRMGRLSREHTVPPVKNTD